MQDQYKSQKQKADAGSIQYKSLLDRYPMNKITSCFSNKILNLCQTIAAKL